MKKIAYEQLASLSNSAINEIAASRKDFVVLADAKVGRHFQNFVMSDEVFRNSGQTMRDRITYLCGGWHAFWVLPFLQIWNRACIEGYEVKRIDVRDNGSEVWFSRK